MKHQLRMLQRRGTTRVIVSHDEYDQYFISIEQKLSMESTDLATAIFNLLGCHYIFNLSYLTKLTDMMRFIQEKVAQISSTRVVRWKSAVSTMAFPQSTKS